MADLNQFAISKILGSTIMQVAPFKFGNFSLMSGTEEIQKALRGDDQGVDPPTNTDEQDATIVQAFENVREGASTDELLWNNGFKRTFAIECRNLGLNDPQSYFIRRLINVRKNSSSYRKKGIEIIPTIKKEVHPSIVPEYAPVIEFALVRLRYRYGSSIDDILIDDCLGDKFDGLAHQIAPALSSRDLRLGALYIRKNRVMKKKDREEMIALDLAVVERQWERVSTLSKLKLDDVPASPGLIEVKEHDRYLYIAQNMNIQWAARELGTGDAFQLMAGGFWKPNLDRITISFAAGKKVAGVAIDKWERKLIHDLSPIFNWPMPQDVA